MSKSKVEHTTIRNEKLFCLNCGGQHPLVMPIPIKEMTNKIDAFNVLHKDCQKTWSEPVADINGKTLEENKNWWLLHGEHGISSKNMFAVLSGGYSKSDGKLMTPCDPSDFNRCSKLLQAVPQWKTELNKLKPVSETWSKLVDNWDKLETMLVEAKVLWSKGIGASEMYEFMKKLGCQ